MMRDEGVLGWSKLRKPMLGARAPEMLLAGQPEDLNPDCVVERYEGRLFDLRRCNLEGLVGIVCDESLIDAGWSIQRRRRAQHCVEELKLRQIAAEDEQTARRSETQHWRYVRVDDVTPDHSIEFGERVCIDVGVMEDDFMRPGEAQHAARHDPARVLREVEAKRRIIDLYEQQAAKQSENAMEEDRTWTLEPVILLLALPYADHEDYREEWRP